MDEVELLKMHDELNKIRFKGCEDIRFGDVLYYTYKFVNNVGFLSGCKSFVKIFADGVYPKLYDVQVVGIPETIALFSHSYGGRQDHKKSFINATSVLDNCVKLFSSKRRFCLSGINKIFKAFKWSHQMKSAVPRLSDRMRYSSEMLQIYNSYRYIQRLIKKNKWNINALLVWCDVMQEDSYFVQKYNAQGKTTITLQHGFFNINSNSFAYEGSHSTYFLADSEASIELARKVGKKEKMIAVGSPHNFNKKEAALKTESREIKSIGIIMNAPMSAPREDNIEMIRSIQEYCRANGKTALLKLHPADDISVYRDVVDESVAAFCVKGCSIDEFESQIDVAVVSASTVFLTLLNDGIPTLLFARREYDPKLFYNVEELKFASAQEFSEKSQWLRSESYKEVIARIRKQYIVAGDVKDNYIRAYKQIGIL